MSVNDVTGVGRVVLPATASRPPDASAPRAGEASSSEQVDESTQRPVPPRFPWLSRLSHQLESASGQRPAFTPAPMLGDHVDHQV